MTQQTSKQVFNAAITAVLTPAGRATVLGRPVPEHLLKRVTVPVGPAADLDADSAALQQKVDKMTLAEFGGVVRLASNYFHHRQRRDSEDPVTQLVWYGVNSFLDVAAEIAVTYDPQVGAKESLRRTRTQVFDLDRVVSGFRTRLEDRMLFVVNRQLNVELDRLEDQLQAAISEAQEQGTHGVTEAQREATSYRRQLDAASAQLARERDAHAAEIARLTATLETERRAVVARERDTRNRIQQLEQDARSSASVIASLNAECERLEALTVPPLEVFPMTQTAAAPTNALERTSLTAFLRVRLQKPALSQAEALAPLAYDQHWAEWRAAYPTADSQKKQLARAISKKAA